MIYFVIWSLWFVVTAVLVVVAVKWWEEHDLVVREEWKWAAFSLVVIGALALLMTIAIVLTGYVHGVFDHAESWRG